MNAIPAPSETSSPNHLARPLRDLPAWLAHFRSVEIPVLDATAASVAELVDHEDGVDAHLLAETIGHDPLMTLKLLAHVGTASRRETDVETVVGALVLMGIGPFFRRFGTLPTISQALAGAAQGEAARAGLQAVLDRSDRAARFALAFAAHRLDPDAAVIHEAALLNDFAELLLWCHAPMLALHIAERQKADPTLRSAAVQREVLGITLAELKQGLMRAWRLPALLVRLGDERHANDAQVRCVALALRVARHSARGWDDAGLPDDVSDVAALLQLGAAPTLKLLHDIDA